MELSKDYEMNVHYYQCKANVIVDVLSRMTMGSTADVEDVKKELMKDAHRLAILGVQIVDSPGGGVSVHPSF